MEATKRIGLLVALISMITVVLVVCQLAVAADAPPASLKGKKLSFAAGATGSAGFARSVQWAQILNSQLGTEIAVETSAGAAAGPTLVHRKAADMAGAQDRAGDAAVGCLQNEVFQLSKPIKHDVKLRVLADKS